MRRRRTVTCRCCTAIRRRPFPSDLKERLFGLSGPQGNHGEDVKEVYWYTDATPTHSYMSMLYRYPQAAFPFRSERAAFRAERPAREPRRRREGSLLVHRCDADAQLHVDVVPLSAGGLSLPI